MVEWLALPTGNYKISGSIPYKFQTFLRRNQSFEQYNATISN